MKTLATLLSPLYLLTWLFTLSLITPTHAADLTFTPATPLVEINKTITLSVQGAVGTVKWTTIEGTIQGDGLQVTYLAPAQAGLDAVTVLDSAGNLASVKVVITPPQTFSLENAQWEIFTNRSKINALSLSEDGKTLWVGTNGGLEKWDTETTELKRIFTELDGLPSSYITNITNDDNNGLWVVAGNYSEEDVSLSHFSLSHFSYDEKWVFFHQNNSKLPPATTITAIISDDRGGVWVGTSDGLIHIDSNYKWTIYNTSNSKIPDNSINALAKDGLNGLWIGTANKSLAYFDGNEWTVIESKCSTGDIVSDGQGGLWFGGYYYSDGTTVDGNCLLGHYSNGEWTFPEELNLSWSELSISNIVDDGNGGVWMGTGFTHYSPGSNKGVDVLAGGLIHVDAQSETTFFENPYGISDAPYSVGVLAIDHHGGGVWISFQTSGWLGNELAYKNPNGKWKVANRNNLYLPSNGLYLPSNGITSLANDGKNGLWIGIGSGEECSAANCNNGFLVHMDSHNELKIFNDANSNLPNNNIIQVFSDESGGAWIATGQSADGDGYRVAHVDNKWNIITIAISNSGCESSFRILSGDGEGGVWVTTDAGDLAHVTNDGVSTVLLGGYCSGNEGMLLSNLGQSATFINGDGSGGIWIKVSDYVDDFSEIVAENIVHLDHDGEIIGIFDSDYELPHVNKELWSITNNGDGLVYLGKENKNTVFNLSDLKIPGDKINYTLPTDDNSLWISTDKNLAHLTFGRQNELCIQAQIDAATCQAIQQGQHAAIIVAAGGAQDTNTLWESTEAITTRLYRTFYRRGFDKSHIYYLSPKTWADFNGDGYNDHIDRIKADRNLTFDDLQAAFTWAKGLGKLDQPLYFFFMDHGGEGKLQLSPELNITAEQLKTLLDDYQTTGNSLIAVIEACHSGSLIPVLTAPNRAVIASAKYSQFAYFFEKKGFSRFLADYLLKGSSFAESFTLAGRDQEKLLGKNRNLQTAGGTGLTMSQTPQFDDNQDGTFTTTDGQWLKTVYINGSFTTADATLAVINQTPATTLPVGQAVTLQAKVTLTQGTVNRVWAVIRPPAIAQILDTNGTPILAFPRLELGHAKDNPELWQGTWNEAVYNGNYLITFYAEDNEKNIASSEQDTVLTVTGGIDPPAQAQVQIHLEKDRYQRGEPFKVSLTEELGWGYDLYAAVLLPDKKTFMTLKETNGLRPVNEAKPWYAPRKAHSPLTLLDLTVPATLPTGEYCLFGILSPAQGDVFETAKQNLWVMDTKCVEVVP